jgi:hypothetical protein
MYKQRDTATLNKAQQQWLTAPKTSKMRLYGAEWTALSTEIHLHGQVFSQFSFFIEN